MSFVKCNITTLDGLYKVEPMPSAELVASNAKADITASPSVTYQPFLGVGFSVDATSVFNYYGMSAQNRHDILTEFFSPERQNCSVARICLGSSDMIGCDYYSYDDIPADQTDFELKNFSITRDEQLHIIDILHEILEINPDVKIFASCWSPPAWMKSNKSLLGIIDGKGGELLDGCVEVYARYLYKAVCAYHDRGIKIFGLNPINEPNWNNNTYPQCYVSPEQEGMLIKKLAALFKEEQIDTKLLIMDTDFIHTDVWAIPELEDDEVNRQVWGVAFHPYDGKPTEMTKVHDRFPDKAIIFTERSWDSGNRIYALEEAIDIFRNHARTYIDWVNFSDDTRQPIIGPYHCAGWVSAKHGNLNDWWYPILL